MSILYEVSDASALINSLAKQYTGITTIVEADASNISDFGRKFNDLPEGVRDNFSVEMTTLITEQIFVQKAYVNDYIDIVKSTGWDNGGITQKTRVTSFPEFESDDVVYNPAVGESNDPFVNYGYETESDYYMNKEHSTLKYSIYKRNMTGVFKDAESMMSFIAMVEHEAVIKIRQWIDNLQRTVVNSAIAAVLKSGKPKQKVNFIELFNKKHPDTPITVNEYFTNPEACRMSIAEMNKSVTDLADFNTLCNLKGWENSSNLNDLHLCLLSDWITDVGAYCQADVFQMKFLELPGYRAIKKLQGTGTTGDFSELSRIKVKVKLPWEPKEVSIDQSNIVGFAMSKDMCSVYNLEHQITTQVDPVGLKTNKFIHISAETMIDPYEDLVVFYLANT